VTVKYIVFQNRARCGHGWRADLSNTVARKTGEVIAKLMAVFVNIDTMTGADLDIGLANLKAIAER